MSNTLYNEVLTRGSILKNYFCGKASENDCKIGLEYERIPLRKSTLKSVEYAGHFGIYEFLKELAQIDGWELIKDDFNLVGIKKGEDQITLEPGCQFEIGTSPQKDIYKIKEKIDDFSIKISPLLDKYGMKLLPYGISPLSTYKFIHLIPKKRYYIMADYLWGILSDVMMRETAGIQCCIDYTSEEDSMKKFIITNKMMPFMTAMFANSPIRGGADTGYKSFRALSWLNTDNERCGFINKKIFDKNAQYFFRDYMNDIFETPMIYIKRKNYIPINGKINFKQFITEGYEGYHARLSDFELQANLCFPEIRLRDFIEIRNHDCVPKRFLYSILAIYKGIMYNKHALDAIENLFADYNYEDFAELRYNVPKLGLGAEFGKHKAADIAKSILNIANFSLRNSEDKEFLEPIQKLVNNGRCPADKIIGNWYTKWNKDISKLVEYLSEE